MYPNMRYKDFSNDIKKKNYYFQCKHAGKKNHKIKNK